MTGRALQLVTPGPAAPGSGDAQGLLQQVPTLYKEFKRRPVQLAAVFAGIALLALLAGMLIPKKFGSSTSILVEESNIIAPLMEGRAVPTGVTDRAVLTREVAFSRRVMQEILKAGGWLRDNPSAVEQDKLIERIKDRTSISIPQPNLIRIAYTDTDPERAFDVTRSFADLVIRESLKTKERESREAYEFIDQQVQEYHDKLAEAENKLQAYRSSNPDARPGVDADVTARIGELRRAVESSKLELIDLRSEESALQSQLSGQREITAIDSPTRSMGARLMQLQSERDQLLLSFTEQHPDVVRLQHQIMDLQEQIRDASARRDSGAGRASALNDVAELNPLREELKSKLAQAQRRSAATASRIATAEGMLANEMGRSISISSAEEALAELTRDYEVNRDLYQDLLKRRENARVSMNLDAEQRGLSFRIQEPAALPLRPQGLRLMYVAAAGLLLAVLAPVLLLFGLVRFDPRVRSAQQIETLAGLPVLGVVPPYHTRAARDATTRRYMLASLLLLSVPVVYGIVMATKFVHHA